MELYQASQQWATRPADERFNSLEEMYAATKHYAESAVERTFKWEDLRTEAVEGDVYLTRGKVGAKLTHHSFGQIASKVGAPAGYLRGLPATLAVQNLNHGLKAMGPQPNDAQLLFHQNGSLVLRAATTEVYSRIWNYEVIDRLIGLSQRENLIPGQQTFSWSGEKFVRDENAAKALYASDHDMFVFLMDPEKTITDPVGKELRRGIIVKNTEVGGISLKVMGFLFRDVCCNHIIWGAQDLAEISLRHVGDIRQRWIDAQVRIRKYLDSDTSMEQSRILELSARIADTREGVLDKLFGVRSLGLSRKALDASYDAVVTSEDGDARTVWGFAQGITRYSQQTTFADERNELDRAAGRLLAMQF